MHLSCSEGAYVSDGTRNTFYMVRSLPESSKANRLDAAWLRSFLKISLSYYSDSSAASIDRYFGLDFTFRDFLFLDELKKKAQRISMKIFLLGTFLIWTLIMLKISF